MTGRLRCMLEYKKPEECFTREETISTKLPLQLAISTEK